MPFSFTVEVQHTAVLIAIFILDYANISKFLNRLLGLEVSLQNALFQYFTNTLEAVILQAKRNGRYDEGILGWYFFEVEQVMLRIILQDGILPSFNAFKTSSEAFKICLLIRDSSTYSKVGILIR